MASLVSQLVKNPPAMQETCVRSLGWEDPPEKGKATHSSILAWRIPWLYSSWGCKELDTTERLSLSLVNRDKHPFLLPRVCCAGSLWGARGLLQPQLTALSCRSARASRVGQGLSCPGAGGLLVLQPGMELMPPELEGKFLTARPEVVLVVQSSPAHEGDVTDEVSIPGSGRSPGEGHGNLFVCPCLEDPVEGGAWWAAVHGVTKSQMPLQWLSMHRPPEKPPRQAP